MFACSIFILGRAKKNPVQMINRRSWSSWLVHLVISVSVTIIWIHERLHRPTDGTVDFQHCCYCSIQENLDFQHSVSSIHQSFAVSNFTVHSDSVLWSTSCTLVSIVSHIPYSFQTSLLQGHAIFSHSKQLCSLLLLDFDQGHAIFIISMLRDSPKQIRFKVGSKFHLCS